MELKDANRHEAGDDVKVWPRMQPTGGDNGSQR